MNSSALPQQERGKKRRRPALACTECRRRKMKCDQNLPCNNCTGLRRSECIFPAEAERATSRPKANWQDNHTLDVATWAQATANIGQTQDVHQSIIEQPRTPFPAATSAPSAPSPEVQLLQSKIRSLENRLSAIGTPTAEAQHENGSGSRSQGPAQERQPWEHRFANQSSWLNDTTLHSRILRCLSLAQKENPDLRRVMTMGKTLAHRIEEKLNSSDGTDPRTFATRLLDQARTNRLVDNYFAYFEDVFRIIDIPSFVREYDEYWQNSKAGRDIFILQLQLCTSLGMLASKSRLDYGNEISESIREARNWLEHAAGGPRKRQLTLDELQLLCLLCLAEANGAASERQSWVDAGDLLRKAMSLNLHRDPSSLGPREVEDAALRRRLWATILELNLLLSIQAAQSPLIASSDWDTCAPDVDGGLAHNPTWSRRMTDHRAGQNLVFKSFRLRLKIVSKTQESGSSLPYDQLLQYHAELSQVHSQITKFLDKPPGGNSVKMALLLLPRYILHLHLPLMGKSIKDPHFHFSRRVCVSTAHEVLQLCGLSDSSGLRLESYTDDQFHCLCLNSSGIFRNIIMQAVFATFLESVTLAEETTAGSSTMPAWDQHRVREQAYVCEKWIEMRADYGSPDLPACCFIAGCHSYAVSLHADQTVAEFEEKMIKSSVRGCERYYEGLVRASKRLGLNAAEIARAEVRPHVGLPPVVVDDWQVDMGVGGFDDVFFGFDWAALQATGGQIEVSSIQNATSLL